MKENYLALLLSIVGEFSANKSLVKMGMLRKKPNKIRRF